MRNFDTGATRDDGDGKLDYEGSLSPLALERYVQYMHKHCTQADGEMRSSDNWQKGIPIDVYMKSMFRHFFDLWKIHRGLMVVYGVEDSEIDREEALCAVIFNAMGMLHETLKASRGPLSGDRCAGGICNECEHNCEDPPSRKGRTRCEPPASRLDK